VQVEQLQTAATIDDGVHQPDIVTDLRIAREIG
jgi:hypothetical protein